jgi:hypothetical protein
MAAAACKRPCQPSSIAEPQPLPTRALPEPMWEEHLLPLLTCQEAAWLGCTCKALRGLVREQFRGLGILKVKQLRAALTTFPRARTVELHDSPGWDGPQGEALVQWLRERGRGRGLERVTTGGDLSDDVFNPIQEALQAGALPSLKNITALLKYPTHQASLTGGFVAAMHELRLTVDLTDDEDFPQEPQLAALGLVRQLPALARLELRLEKYAFSVDRDLDEVDWPPFIPPSLRALRVELESQDRFASESLLRALPGMLVASQARLLRLEVFLWYYIGAIGDALIHLLEVVRCCSPALKDFYLTLRDGNPFHAYRDEPDGAIQLERLHTQWAEVLADVSTCRELEVLVLPRVKAEPLFPLGSTFARLTHLEISDYEREHPPDAGMMGLWGLPALAKLSVRLEGRWESIEHVRSRVAPALEAVADTVTHLHLEKYNDSTWSSDEVKMGYELGAAVGQLRRLKDLALDLFESGRAYQAFVQGLATSGGGRLLPLLHRMSLVGGVKTDPDLLASLLLPSVRVFCLPDDDNRKSLLTACALRQAAYKHTWITPDCSNEIKTERAVLREIAFCDIVHEYRTEEPEWVIFYDLLW